MSAVAVADGVGTSMGSQVAARLAVTRFLEQVKDIDVADRDISAQDVRACWRGAGAVIVQYYREHLPEYAGSANPLQTTLLTLIEFPDVYYVSYLGNGSVWYIRGDFLECLDHRWPWSLTDLLVGHTFLDDNGKEALYGILSHDGLSVEPCFVSLSKDRRCGEIFLITTDGISSGDQLKIGHDPDNKLWIEVNPHVQGIVSEHLPRFFQNVESGLDAQDAHDGLLKTTLDAFLHQERFTDDATIAVLVSGTAIEYYMTKRRRNVSSHEDSR